MSKNNDVSCIKNFRTSKKRNFSDERIVIKDEVYFNCVMGVITLCFIVNNGGYYVKNTGKRVY